MGFFSNVIDHWLWWCNEQKENELDSHKLFDMFNSIYACPMPVIGRINGNAIGGGSGLVSACDFAFSVRSSLSLSRLRP
jgi:enoyl-CoA hydratase/carnithine racemase